MVKITSGYLNGVGARRPPPHLQQALLDETPRLISLLHSVFAQDLPLWSIQCAVSAHTVQRPCSKTTPPTHCTQLTPLSCAQPEALTLVATPHALVTRVAPVE